MANSSRRMLDNSGNQFMPMNVNGGNWNEHFMSTKKLIIIGIVFFWLLFMLLGFTDSEPTVSKIILNLSLWAFVSQLLIRYVVFEEKTYYKLYQLMKEHEITTPALFWGISSIKNGYDGAIMTYTDTKIGILVKLERDTITGKSKNFKEIHYDAFSDFYRELIQYGYKFVEMNIMEQAGNDPRLDELDKLIVQSTNKNIRSLMEKEIGHIKNISHKTLYESDYFLIYTSDLQKVDNIIEDTMYCLYKLLDGAYVGYRVLSAREIIEFVKEEYGVKYFNYTQATLDMFKIHGATTKRPFEMVEINYSDGTQDELNAQKLQRVYEITNKVLDGSTTIEEIKIKEEINKKIIENSNIEKYTNFDLSNISSGYIVEQREVQDNKNKINFRNKKSLLGNVKKKKLKQQKTEQNTIKAEEQIDIDDGEDIDI